MIIHGDTQYGPWPSVLYLSKDLYEYRKHNSKVRSPRVTIDLHEGIMMGGPMKYIIANADALHAKGVLTILDSQYRYLMFSFLANRIEDSMNGHKFGSHLVFNRSNSLNFPTHVTLRTVSGAGALVDSIVFGNGVQNIMESTHEWLKEVVSTIIMKGIYTDKQPKIASPYYSEDDVI